MTSSRPSKEQLAEILRSLNEDVKVAPSTFNDPYEVQLHSFVEEYSFDHRLSLERKSDVWRVWRLSPMI